MAYFGVYGYVYFIQCPTNGMIKIGRSDGDPQKRLAGIQSMSPVPLKPLGVIWGDTGYEGRLHRIFAATRHHGEWFLPSPKLLNFVDRWVHPWESLSRTKETARASWTAAERAEFAHHIFHRYVIPDHPLRLWKPKMTVADQV